MKCRKGTTFNVVPLKILPHPGTTLLPGRYLATYGAIFGYQKMMGGRGVGTLMEAKDVVVCIRHGILKRRTITHNNEEENEDEKER